MKMGLLEQHLKFGFQVGCLESGELKLGCRTTYRGLDVE